MKKQHLISIAVAAMIIAGGSFYGGTMYAKSGTSVQRGTQGASVLMGRGNRSGMTGGFTTGKIVSSDEKSMTVEMAAGPDGSGGGSKIIFTSDSMSVFKMAEGSIADLVPGTEVTVTGTPNADGSLTAQSIQIRPEGMGMPFGGALRTQDRNQPPSGGQ